MTLVLNNSQTEHFSSNEILHNTLILLWYLQQDNCVTILFSRVYYVQKIARKEVDKSAKKIEHV